MRADIIGPNDKVPLEIHGRLVYVDRTPESLRARRVQELRRRQNVGDDPRPPSRTTTEATNAARVTEPNWDTVSDQQVQQIYTSAGLALYNYLRWGVQELVREAHEGFRDLDLSSSLAELRRNFYASRAHWRSGAKKAAARLMWRTSKLALEQHARIMELGAQEPALLRRLNALGLRGYAEQLGRAIEATASGVRAVATAAGAGLGIVLLAGVLLFAGGNKS